MTETEKHIEEKNITLKGLEKTYEKFLEFKKSKNNELVVVGNFIDMHNQKKLIIKNKNFHFLLLVVLILIGCNNYSKDTATLLETKKYVVFTKKENLNRVFLHWLKSQKDNVSVIDEDTKLYNDIKVDFEKKPWNVYKISNSLNKLNRLQFHTAFLLETNQAYIFEKNSKKILKVTLEKSDSDRKFIVNDTVILHVIDRYY